MKLSPDSVVVVGDDMHHWSEKGGEYAERISRSRFCFCPRGDTISSRRIFDAIAAGCIPVITTEELEALPFMRTGLNYSEFTVVADHGSFRTTDGVKAIVEDLSSRLTKTSPILPDAVDDSRNQRRVVSLSALSLLSDCVRLCQLREVHHNLQQARNPQPLTDAERSKRRLTCTSLMLCLWVMLKNERVRDVNRSDQQLLSLREGLVRGRSSTVYGMTRGTGRKLADMEPFHGTASRFLQEVQIVLGNGGLWNCPSSHLPEKMLSPRTLTELPPNENERSQWLRESETIVNEEQSLLFCAPPNTGSLQFRMLAKRMKGVKHWSVSNIHSLLFDSVDSKLPLLDLTDKEVMEAIYKDNNSGWIKVGVVRDPVTRLLSAYLDLVCTWSSRSTRSSNYHDPQRPHRGLWVDDEWEWFDAITRHRGLAGDEVAQQQPEVREHQNPVTWGENREGKGGEESGNMSGGLQDPPVPTVPTFEELLELLEGRPWAAPSAFRPAASLCGMGLSSFDTIIPFETLQQTSAKVLKSLPGDIWRDFGQSGWGPHGDHAFMEFDYGTVARSYPYADQDAAGYKAVEREQNGDEKAQTTSPPTISPRARDLFVDGSCAWTEYYTDRTILEKAGSLYRQDFDLFGWYDLYAWRERLEACLQ